VQRAQAEEELRRLSVEMRYLEQTAEVLQQRISMVNAAITDLTYANATLDGIEKEKENVEMLVPIGGSSYVKVKLADSSKVIVGMGSGVSVEKPLPDAKVALKERLEELEKSMNSAQQQFAQVAERINTGRGRLESLLASGREGNLKAMFEKLKSGFKGLVNKVTTTELKTESLTPLLSDFKMSLAENDVAFPVADKICDELEKRLVGVSVKRLEDRKKNCRGQLKASSIGSYVDKLQDRFTYTC